MQQITESDVRQTLSMPFVLSSIKEAYKDAEAGKLYSGNRIFMPVRGEENVGQWLVANSTNKPYFGSKFSAVFPGNTKINLPGTISKISLYSAETGELLSLIDANDLTSVKTGGSSAVATDLMARKDASKLGIIGTGEQALYQVLAIQEVRQIETLYVSGRNPDRIAAFTEKINEIKNRPYNIIITETAEECVASSDIVCTCTNSKVPVFNGVALKAGTHINAIGSFTTYMQEIDTDTVKKADKIVTEHTEGLWEAAGDLVIPHEAGEITKDKLLGSIGEALTGKIPLRETAEEITINESVGSGVLDIALSIAVYERLSK